MSFYLKTMLILGETNKYIVTTQVCIKESQRGNAGAGHPALLGLYND